MNEQQFAAIQQRWSDASGGPWTVEAAWKPVAEDETVIPCPNCKGMSEEDWSIGCTERYRMVYAMPPKMVAGRRKVVDKKLGNTEVDEPEPAFFVTNSARPADLVFVRQAPEDMGILLQAVEDLMKETKALKADLLIAHQEAASAKSRLDQYIHASQALKLAAARLLEIP